jgi:hypothetical protein
MLPEHAGHLLHRFEARAHDLDAPLVEERPGPIEPSIVPEVVEPFPEQHGAHSPQVVLHELAQAGALVARLVLSAFEQQRAFVRSGCRPRCRSERTSAQWT